MQSADSRIEMMSETQSELMLRFYDGGKSAFDELARRLRPSLLCQTLQQLPSRHIGRHQLAEDLVQQAFIKAMLTLERPEIQWQAGKGSVRTWLGTILRNVVTSYLRSPASRQRVTTDFAVADDETSGERMENQVADYRLASRGEKMVAENQRQWFVHQVDRLPKKIQAIISLKLKGRTHQQIAKSLGISKSTVTYHFDTAKRMLRTLAATAA
jgi:RNA polymerase sigma factor (sigma-70 family)